jgi:1,4-alpha-glucan branching enzyme
MIRKEFVQRDGAVVCRATFRLPSKLWADSVYLVGDFNNWNKTSHPLVCAPDGTCAVTVEFEVGRYYQFRYLADGQQWVNDNQADAYVPNPYGTSNCVLITDPAFVPYRDEEEKRREGERNHHILE